MFNTPVSLLARLLRTAGCVVLLAVTTPALAAGPAPAPAHEGGAPPGPGPMQTVHGELHYVDVEARRLVIDDQTRYFGPELTIRGRDGNIVASVADLEAGAPLEYVQQWRGRAWFVVAIRVLDTLPAVNDDEEEELR